MATTTRAPRAAQAQSRTPSTAAGQPHPVYGHTIVILPNLPGSARGQRQPVFPFEATFVRPEGGYYDQARFHRSLSAAELRSWLYEDGPGDRPQVAYTARWTREP